MNAKARARCPICRKPAVARFRPFCSGRCTDVDLARWFTGAYRVRSDERADESEDEASDDER